MRCDYRFSRCCHDCTCIKTFLTKIFPCCCAVMTMHMYHPVYLLPHIHDSVCTVLHLFLLPMCAEQVACFDIRNSAAPQFVFAAHKKTTSSIGFSTQVPGMLATASLDKTVKVRSGSSLRWENIIHMYTNIIGCICCDWFIAASRARCTDSSCTVFFVMLCYVLFCFVGVGCVWCTWGCGCCR